VEFSVDRLVSVGHTIFTTAWRIYVVSAIDGHFWVRADNSEFIKENSNEITPQPTVLVKGAFHSSDRSRNKNIVAFERRTKDV